MGEAYVTRKADLEEVGRRFLAGGLSYGEFRGQLLEVWERLSRMALPREERESWRGFVNAVRNTKPDELRSDMPGPPLFDEYFFRERLAALLNKAPKPTSTGRVARARKIQRSIAEVLLAEWDPIGIKDIPEAADEYDSYVGGVYRLIASGASPGELAKHLVHLESGMGVPRDPDVLLPVARRLLALDVKL
jgi:hypothetical protein